jgi:hypothetical protein
MHHKIMILSPAITTNPVHAVNHYTQSHYLTGPPTHSPSFPPPHHPPPLNRNYPRTRTHTHSSSNPSPLHQPLPQLLQQSPFLQPPLFQPKLQPSFRKRQLLNRKPPNMNQRLPPLPHVRHENALRERRRGLESEYWGLALPFAFAFAFAFLSTPLVLARLARRLGVCIRDCYVVDGFYVGCGAEVLYAGCEAFGAWEEEVRRQGLVCFKSVGGGREAFGWC